MFAYIFPIVCGAAVGAVLRWLFGLVLVSSAPFSIGTLAANWLGALLIGVLAELLTDPQWRLLWITGFLGSLTTFSGFFCGNGRFDAGTTLGHGFDGNLSAYFRFVWFDGAGD